MIKKSPGIGYKAGQTGEVVGGRKAGREIFAGVFLKNFGAAAYLCGLIRDVAQLVACLYGVQEVVGSNPAIPTNKMANARLESHFQTGVCVWSVQRSRPTNCSAKCRRMVLRRGSAGNSASRAKALAK